MPPSVVDANTEADHVLVLILLVILRVAVVVVQCHITAHHQHQYFVRIARIANSGARSRFGLARSVTSSEKSIGNPSGKLATVGMLSTVSWLRLYAGSGCVWYGLRVPLHMQIVGDMPDGRHHQPGPSPMGVDGCYLRRMIPTTRSGVEKRRPPDAVVRENG
uniref:Uncharacterized protein n=1 Tax=Anopheles farauti TaxID=69004 RepID=A0A182QSY1_9DIPT